MKTLGIILAAGRGKRMNSDSVNKTALRFNGKSLVSYGVDLFENTVDQIVVVIGAYADSVKEALSDKVVTYAVQEKMLGTGNAVKVAMDKINNDNLEGDVVLVGYGDHMMYYSTELVKDLISKHEAREAVITLVSTIYDDPTGLGRIIRNEDGDVERIVEEKDAMAEEKQINEINAGFYSFDRSFLKNNIEKLEKSPITGEYYLTDLIQMAKEQNKKVAILQVPYENVGIGVNTPDQLEKSRDLYVKTHSK